MLRGKISRVPKTLGNLLATRQLSSIPATATSTEPSASKDATSVPKASNDEIVKAAEGSAQKPRKKTLAELDEELRLKMEARSGDGGSAGIEYEDGKPAAMKRGVRDNMFRLI